MTSAYELEFAKREGPGRKSELSRLREERRVPAVVYGASKPPALLAVASKELKKIMASGGINAVIRLKGKAGDGGDTVILKHLQLHVVTHEPLHADFQRISLKEKLEVKVPLETVGEAPGAKLHGGVLEHLLRELKILSLPGDIPQKVEVDVSKLEIGQSILVRDLILPPAVEVLESPDHIVVNVVQPTKEEEPALAAAAAATGAEPEVIAKGKKEVAEGEAAAAAPAAKGAPPQAAQKAPGGGTPAPAKEASQPPKK